MSSHKKLIFILAISFLLVFVLAYSLFQISKSRSYQFFGEIYNKKETNQKIIALTFDDAPTEYTNEILKILADKKINATFYAIGKNIEQFPEITKEIINQGNELGNHSYSHQRMILKSPSFIKNEIETTNQLIRNTGSTNEITFRPPNGKKLFLLPWYLSKHNIKTIMWDIEPDTYYQGNKEKIIEYTVANTKPGSILLLHPFCEKECEADRQALPEIIDQLREQGYTFLTVNQLLNSD